MKKTLTHDEAKRFIEDESERLCVARLGYIPAVWYTGGSDHNDDRLVADVDGNDLVVGDGNMREVYSGDLTEEALGSYVKDWLDMLWDSHSSDDDEEG